MLFRSPKDDRSSHDEETEILAKEIEGFKLRNMKPLTSTYLAAPATEYPIRSQSPDMEMKTPAGRNATPELRNEAMSSRIYSREKGDEMSRTGSGIARTITPELGHESMHSRVGRGESRLNQAAELSLEVPKSEGVSRSTTPDLVNDSMHSRVASGMKAGEVKQEEQKLPCFLEPPMGASRSVTPELVNDSMHSRVIGAV